MTAKETIRENYDRLAEQYANHLFDELRHKPFDRQTLDGFAERTRGTGDVCDLGCGPGHVARYLHDADVSVFGLDLSPGMLDQARRLNPGISFREGDMLSLDISTGSLAGIVAFYAIVNIPKESIAIALREMARVLTLGGHLLLSFHVGHEVIHVEELWGVPVSIDFNFLDTQGILKELEAAGLVVDKVTEREPYEEVEYPSRRAYILAHKGDT